MDKPLVDILWITVCSCLVFIMQAGFLCLETGMTRSKNAINVAIKNLTDFGISVLLFWVFGFALMFGMSWHGWVGTTLFWVPVGQGDPWLSCYFIFQAMFCATAATIVSGAVAERMRFGAYIIVAIVVSTLIYPIFGHWSWGGSYEGLQGWLASKGFIDFAGSSVVHSVGGWVALAVLIIIGPRSGRFSNGEAPKNIPRSNLPVAMLGVLLLFFGWFGFNGGSTLSLNYQVTGIIANTTLSGAAGLVTTLIVGWPLRKVPDVTLPMNGVLAGLVAITANCHAVTAGSAIIIGAVGGVIMLMTEYLLEHWQIDDVISAVPVHLAAGIWGTLAVALFGDPEILGTGLTWGAQLQVQAMGVVSCFIYSFGAALIIFMIINRFYPLRVTHQEEHIGLNVSEHKAATELISLLNAMDYQSQTKDLDYKVPVEPFTEIGQIAQKYNDVMEALNIAVSKTNAIVKNIGEGIVTFAQDGLLTSFNPAAERIFGFTSTEIVGQPFSRLLSNSNGSGELSIKNYQTNFEANKNISKTIEAIGIKKNGSKFLIEINIAKGMLIKDFFYMGIIRDITERKNFEKSIIKKNMELTRSNKELEEFAYIASHDLQEPLRKVKTFGSRLVQKYGEVIEDQGKDYLKRMDSATNRMQTLINDLLTYSRVTSKAQPFTPVDLSNIVHEVLSDLEIKIEEANAQIHVDNLPTIEADPLQMRQLFQNLIGNALKFHKPGASPVVKIRSDLVSSLKEDIDEKTLVNEQLRVITVADNGIGFEKKYKEQIFTVFQRLHGRSEYTGTGIGLAVCRKIVARHGGHIKTESAPGEGSTFIITLPVLQPKEKEEGDA